MAFNGASKESGLIRGKEVDQDEDYEQLDRGNCSVGGSILWFTNCLTILVGLSMLSLIIWSLVWKLTAYGYFMDILVDSTFFALPAMSLVLPVVCITLITKNRVFLMLTLIAIEVFAISLLFTGYFMGTVYQLHYFNESARLGATIPTQTLNTTLYKIFEIDNKNYDNIQQKFQCCGVYDDEVYDITPSSCYRNKDQNENRYIRGCLLAIQDNVAWHRNMTLSLSQISLLMFFYHTAMTGSVFISNRIKWAGMRRAMATR